MADFCPVCGKQHNTTACPTSKVYVKAETYQTAYVNGYTAGERAAYLKALDDVIAKFADMVGTGFYTPDEVIIETQMLKSAYKEGEHDQKSNG